MGTLPKSRNEPLRSQTFHNRRATYSNFQEAEEAILEEPYAKAVLRVEGNHRRRDVLLAVRTLQRRRTHLNAQSLLLELMDKENARPDPNIQTEDPEPRKGGACKRPASDCCRSDGGDMEAPRKYLDARPSPEDLQDDGGGGAAAVSGSVISGEGAEPREPPRKRKSGQEPAPPPPPTDRASVGGSLRRLRMLRRENRQLRARKVCRQCKESTVSITFLPCGHLCFCYQCGQGFQTCPLCRKAILADVRTFLC